VYFFLNALQVPVPVAGSPWEGWWRSVQGSSRSFGVIRRGLWSWVKGPSGAVWRRTVVLLGSVIVCWCWIVPRSFHRIAEHTRIHLRHRST